MYKQSINSTLQPFSTFHVQSTSEIDILQPLSHLNAVLNQATSDSIPRHRSEIKTRKLRQRPWSERILQAVKNCRHKWWEWRKSGAVRDPADEHYAAMIRARKSLRKEQRQESARRRKNKVEEIINAQNDSKPSTN